MEFLNVKQHAIYSSRVNIMKKYVCGHCDWVPSWDFASVLTHTSLTWWSNQQVVLLSSLLHVSRYAGSPLGCIWAQMSFWGRRTPAVIGRTARTDRNFLCDCAHDSEHRRFESCSRHGCLSAFILFVLSCVHIAALRRADPPSKESYRLCIGLRNWKKRRWIDR
jgi:hypothetical protein